MTSSDVTQTGVSKFTIKEENMAHIFVWSLDKNNLRSLFTFVKLQHESRVETPEIRFHTGSLANFDHYIKFYAVPREESKSFWVYCKLYIGEALEKSREQYNKSVIHIKSVKVKSVGMLEKATTNDLTEAFTSEEINSNDPNVIWLKKLFVGGIYAQCIADNKMTFVIQTHNQLWNDCKLTMVLEPFGEVVSNAPSLRQNPGLLDTQSLFMSKKFADVIIECGEKEFPAHRVIISSKSPVFESMFETPMREAKEGRVVIQDAEPDVVVEMLRYMYTGDAQFSQYASQLFLIADKYCVEDLKRISEQALVTRIDENNFLDLYKVGKLLNSKGMIDKCYEIFKKKRKDIMKTEKDMKIFYEKFPELMFRFSTD